MKLRQKVLISLFFAFSICLAALSACADRAGQQSGVTPSSGLDVVAVLTLETEDAVAGLHLEYTVDGTLTGGLMIQPRTTFTTGETVTASLPLDPDNPPDRGSVCFGLSLTVVAEDGTETPVPVYCQWAAEPGVPRSFTLGGSRNAGYTLTPDEALPLLTLTPKGGAASGPAPPLAVPARPSGLKKIFYFPLDMAVSLC